MTTSTMEQYPQLISLAVHEFRTPASVVGGYLRMLQRDSDAPLTDRQRKMIDEAEKSTARLVALVAELSDIGKMDAGLLDIQAKPIDLSSLLEDVARGVQMPADRDVQLSLRLDGSKLPMNGDASRLKTAFDAIFRSVLREHAGPATIVVSARRTADERASVSVVVAETQVLDEASDRPRVAFDEKRGGMGLALPLARRVFERHSGRLMAPAGDDSISRNAAVIVLPITE